MKIKTHTFTVYDFSELSDEAKENVKKWYLDDPCRSDFFYEDILIYLKENFPESDLDVAYSLAYCQGDGLNIYGTLNLFDFLPFWDATEKEKRTIKFYLYNTDSAFDFAKGNHYCYSCKRFDKKDIEYFASDIVYELQTQNFKNINKDIIEKFISDMLDYFYDLDRKFEKQGYEYLYNCYLDEVEDFCSCNDYLFYADGSFYCQGALI